VAVKTEAKLRREVHNLQKRLDKKDQYFLRLKEELLREEKKRAVSVDEKNR